MSTKTREKAGELLPKVWGLCSEEEVPGDASSATAQLNCLKDDASSNDDDSRVILPRRGAVKTNQLMLETCFCFLHGGSRDSPGSSLRRGRLCQTVRGEGLPARLVHFVPPQRSPRPRAPGATTKGRKPPAWKAESAADVTVSASLAPAGRRAKPAWREGAGEEAGAALRQVEKAFRQVRGSWDSLQSQRETLGRWVAT